ncbi:MAG TPA: hypothetical protein VGF30_04680 [Bacteroidia bacterium]
METIISKQKVQSTTKTNVKTANKASKFWEVMETSRFGAIPIILTIVGCLSGIAAAFGAHGSTVELAFIAFPTIISLAMILAVAPMRTIFWLSSIAIVLDILVLIF